MPHRVLLFDDVDLDEPDFELPDAPEQTETPDSSHLSQLKRRVREYAKETLKYRGFYDEVQSYGHPEESMFPILFEIINEEQNTRCGGRCAPVRHNETGEVVDCHIKMNWKFYAALEWPKFASLIRHELCHAIENFRHGESGHSPRFKDLAEEMDAVTHASQEALAQVSGHRYMISCTECDLASPRSKASDPVKRPEQRMCPECETDTLIVEHKSGQTWTNYEEYQNTRSKVEQDPDLSW